MKKNIFYSFIVAILLSSCQGMDLMPADKMSDGDYWLTENDFKIYANGLYPSLMKFNGDDNLAQYDQKADLSTSYFGFNSVSNGRWLPSESDGVWDDCYAYLRKIHILLEHVDALHTTDPKILRYKGEALFFRAYQYFKLLNRFGDVPLVTHSLDIDSPELFMERTPRKERRQIARQQKGIRSGNEYVVLLGCVKAIDRTLKTVAHLNFIDKQKVLFAGHSMLFYIGEQRVILEQVLKLIEVVVDMDDIRIGQMCLHVIAEGLEQF